jgi:hypothetical protein
MVITSGGFFYFPQNFHKMFLASFPRKLGKKKLDFTLEKNFKKLRIFGLGFFSLPPTK